MWSQVAVLCVFMLGAQAYTAVSQHSRVEHFPQEHGHGHEQEHGHHDYAHHHPSYKFAYSVKDSHTGDIKSQEESREGDHVKGSYSLVEPDGNERIVHYSSDDHSGFKAAVHHKTVHHHIVPHHQDNHYHH